MDEETLLAAFDAAITYAEKSKIAMTALKEAIKLDQFETAKYMYAQLAAIKH